jgi:hypothetical protein
MSTPPDYSLLGNCNSVNYDNGADWNGQNGNVTSVGSNGGSSYYGTFDQNGNVWEIIDYQQGNSIVCYGGSYNSSLNELNSLTFSLTPDVRSSFLGFRVCCNSSLDPIPNNFVIVTDINSGSGNIADSSRNNLGSVSYNYHINKYLVTNTEYALFLNSVARDKTGIADAIWPYNSNMNSNVRGGISQTGVSPNLSYVVKTNMGDKPVNFVNWYSVARYVNWLSKNKPNLGTLSSNTTETGVYLLNLSNPATIPVASLVNKTSYWIPNRDEWIKASYYDPTKNGSGGYYLYATNSDSTPDSVSSNSEGIANNTINNPNICISSTPTPSVTNSNTPTPTVTPSITVSSSVSPTPTPTITSSTTPTNTVTPTKTPTVTPSVTNTVTPTRTPTKTPTRTPTRTPTVTPTISVSPSVTATLTPTKTVTPTPSKSFCSSVYLGQLLYNPTIYNNENIKVLHKGFVLSGKLNDKIVYFYEGADVSPTPTPSVTPTVTPTTTPTPSSSSI